MGSYNLEHNEQIILNYPNISRGVMNYFNGELILTDMNIIFVSKNLLGRIKEIQKYPLNMVIEQNGSAHVVVEKKSSGLPVLTVYFKNGLEIFTFSSLVINDAKKMANSINHLVTGSSSEIYPQKFNAIPGAAFAAETLKGTLDTFKDVFGSKVKSQQVETVERVAKKCGACSAPISGIKGQLVNCEYCDTNQQL